MIDFDTHYYEPHDCFTRHIDPKFATKAIEIRTDQPDGLGRPYFEGKRLIDVSVVPGDHAGRPGAMRAFLEGNADRGSFVDDAVRGTDVPEFTDCSARLALMDQQGVEAAVLIPSLGVAVEQDLSHDVEATYANLRAFNRWVEEDWGFGRNGRIFAVALLSLLDLDMAIAELDRVLERGARIVHLRAGPVAGRSPADPVFDPFWSRVAEAGVPVAFHVGVSGYRELYSTSWSELAGVPGHRMSAFQFATCHGERPIVDTLTALVLHNLFGRHPNLRVVTIENGSSWVPNLLKTMDKAAGASQDSFWLGGKLTDKPSEIFRQHVFVVPFFEERKSELIELLGPEHVLFGSDFPHPEGLARPADFLDGIGTTSDSATRRIMHDNAAELLQLVTV